MPSTEELVKAAQAAGHPILRTSCAAYERAAIITAYSVLSDFHLAQTRPKRRL